MNWYHLVVDNPWQTIEAASIIILLINTHFIQKRLLFVEGLTHQHRSDQPLIDEKENKLP